MRKALNENPVVQICVIGVLLVLAGVFFVSQMGGGSSNQSSATSTTAGATPAPGASSTAGTAATGSAATGSSVAGSTAGTVGAAASPATASAASAPPTPATVSPAALVPGPGLPKPVMASYSQGNAIVLLIVRGGGIDDRLVRGSVESLKGEGGISVFVARASKIARYSRITEGVGVSQAPALVVVRPRGDGSSVPEATVSYGFRNAQSVVQSVHDALYTGPDDLPYDPKG